MKKAVLIVFLISIILSSCSEGHLHQWDEGRVVASPSCVEEGVREYSCETCGEKKTETIPTIEHLLGDEKVLREPSGSEKGVIESTCAICGLKTLSYFPARE